MPFRVVKINKGTTISEIIKNQKWGFNKLIYNGGIRVSDEIKFWKEWDVIKDPNFTIDKSCFIGKGKGTVIIKVEVEDKC